MPLVTFTNPKGGSSKTTSAMLLAMCLAHRGQDVAIIDTDPNAPLLRFAKRREERGAGQVEGLNFYKATSETIFDVIDPLSQAANWVIVDTEGTANMTVANALTRTDLAIIPINASRLDVDQGAKAVRMVQTQSKGLRRDIPYRLLFSRTDPTIRGRIERSISVDIEKSALPLFDTQIIRRAAFAAIFEFSQTLWELDPKKVSGVPMAIENAEAFTNSVINVVVAALEGVEQ